MHQGHKPKTLTMNPILRPKHMFINTSIFKMGAILTLYLFKTMGPDHLGPSVDGPDFLV